MIRIVIRILLAIQAIAMFRTVINTTLSIPLTKCQFRSQKVEYPPAQTYKIKKRQRVKGTELDLSLIYLCEVIYLNDDSYNRGPSNSGSLGSS